MIKKIIHILGKLIPKGNIRQHIKRLYDVILHKLHIDNIIYTEDYSLYLKKYETLQRKDIKNKYWNNRKVWNFSEEFPNRFKTMMVFFEKTLLPKIQKDWIVADLGCANGEMSFLVSQYVRHVDGFDISKNMIELAKREAVCKHGIRNICFTQNDIQTMEIEKRYNMYIIFGILMYINDDNTVKNIIEKIYNNLNDDGYLFVKESLWDSQNNVYYIDVPKNYTAIYRSEYNYISMYVENKFELIDKIILEELTNGYRAVCMVFRKTIGHFA